MLAVYYSISYVVSFLSYSAVLVVWNIWKQTWTVVCLRVYHVQHTAECVLQSEYMKTLFPCKPET